MVRFRLKVSNGLIDNRRIDQVRRKGRFSKRPPHYGREGCTLINSFKLERPVFGGTEPHVARHRLPAASTRPG